jgi:Flp pilus assembly protein TadG
MSPARQAKNSRMNSAYPKATANLAIVRALAGWTGARMQAARKLVRDPRGVATVELALVATVMVIIMLPIFDLGMGFYVKTQVMSAAEAGADYAFIHGWVTNNNSGPQTSINSAVMNATGLNGSSSPALTSSATPWTYVNGSSCAGSNCDLWLSCECTDGTTLSDPTNQPTTPYAQSACSSLPKCSGANQNSQTPSAYVTVAAHATYTPIITFLGLGNPITFTATSVVRVE